MDSPLLAFQDLAERQRGGERARRRDELALTVRTNSATAATRPAFSTYMGPSREDLNVRPVFLAMMIGAVGFPASALAGTETWREQSEKVIAGRDVDEVKVENSRGLISVRAVDGDQIHITALKIARGQDKEHAKEFARATQVVTSTEGGQLVIRVRYPQRQTLHVGFWDLFSGGFEFPRVEVRLALEIPRELPLTLGSTSGDLETDGIAGRQTIGTTSGDVTVTDARGDLEASSTSGSIETGGIQAAKLRTVSGDIRVASARGLITVHTTSGDIQLGGMTGELDVTTVSGQVRVDRAPRGLVVHSTSGDIQVGPSGGAVRAVSSSGDVRVELAESLRGAQIETASGDIVVALGRPVGCELDLRTSSGSLDVAVPLEVQTVTRREVTGIVGNGAAQVRLRSSSGDIAVRGGGS